jgi:hypothetical protein
MNLIHAFKNAMLHEFKNGTTNGWQLKLPHCDKTGWWVTSEGTGFPLYKRLQFDGEAACRSVSVSSLAATEKKRRNTRTDGKASHITRHIGGLYLEVVVDWSHWTEDKSERTWVPKDLRTWRDSS